jgi:hypothetical protein
MQVGRGPLWNWGTSNNCLYAANATQSASVRGVYLAFNLSETQAMHGAHARAAGYTAAEGFVVRFTLQVGPLSLPPSGWAKGCVCDRAVQPSSPGHSPRLESRPGWSGRSEAERVMRVKGLQ